MAYLKYDTEKMESVKTTYNACVADMDAIQSKMQTMVDEVRDAWKSEAGDAFLTSTIMSGSRDLSNIKKFCNIWQRT